MSVEAEGSAHVLGKSTWISEEDVWEPPQPVIYALKIIDLINAKKDPNQDLGIDRELRIYASKWISSLKMFKYDHELAGYIVMNGPPKSLIERVAVNLEDLVISTSIILSEDRVSLSDAISYMDLLRRSLGVKASEDYVSSLILRGGRLSDIASRIALLILYTIAYYIAVNKPEDDE